MAERRWRTPLTVAFTGAVLFFGARTLRARWGDVEAVRASTSVDAWGLLWASALVCCSYLVLILTWRATVRAWGESLDLRAGARIWLVSNLGRYVPGKVWQIGAMGVMAQEAGVSGVAAVGSALVVSLVHVIVGFAVVAVTGLPLLRALVPTGTPLVPVLVLAVIGTLATPWMLPWVAMAASRVTGRAIAIPRLPARAVWVAAAGSAAGWLLFGLAFHRLVIALLGHPTGDAGNAIAVFTLSYLAGFLALIAPGGIGVREVVMAGLLTRTGAATGAEATFLVLASRLWLTLLELLPGLLLLLLPRRSGAAPSVRAK